MEFFIAILIQLGFLTGTVEEYNELPENVHVIENKMFVDTETDGIVTIDTDEWI